MTRDIPDCPDCDRPLAVGRTPGEGVCHNCSERFEVGQCEGFGDRHVSENLTTESVPGATLAWCPDCKVTNRERGRWA